MAIRLHLDILFPKRSTKKLEKLLSSRFTDASFIRKLNPKRLVELEEDGGELVVELVEGITIMCHDTGCFHVHCENFDEKNLKLVSKALTALVGVYDVGKESEYLEFVMVAQTRNVPSRKIMKMINRGIKTDLKTQIKNFYQEDFKVGGIRLISAPDISYSFDTTRLMIRVGPRKIPLDRLKDESMVIELIEKSLEKIKVSLKAR